MASQSAMFLTRDGATYLILAFPALLIQATYSIVIYGAVGLGIPPPFNFLIQLTGVATLLIVLAAVATFRPTLAMLTLGASYFLVTLLPRTPTADPLILLIPLFLLMVSFNYGRAAQMEAGRRPIVTSRGPLHLKVLSVSLSGLLPVLAAVVLVTVASFAVDQALVEVGALPYPLADLGRLYLQTRIGFVLLATVAAGILLWVIREFLEPVIIHYSLDGVGARQLLAEEYGYERERLEKKFLKQRLGVPIGRSKPSRGLLATGLVLAVLLLVLFGPTPGDMAEGSGLAAELVPSGLDEEGLVRMVSEAVDYVDSSLLRVENLIRYLISLLWGG